MVDKLAVIDCETTTTGDSQSTAVAGVVIQQTRLHRDVVHVWKLYTAGQCVVDARVVAILHQRIILYTATRQCQLVE